MPVAWPDLVLPPIHQPVLMSALDFEILNQGESMKTIEQELEEIREKNEELEERINNQQKQLDVAMNCIFSLQEKCGDIRDK